MRRIKPVITAICPEWVRSFCKKVLREKQNLKNGLPERKTQHSYHY
jgi:hypothetical protein